MTSPQHHRETAEDKEVEEGGGVGVGSVTPSRDPETRA